MKRIITLILLGFVMQAPGQNTRKALFLGNSYTAVNNLPQLVAQVALSCNDTLVYDSNTPGGYTLQGHFSNTVSTGKIMAGGWDYVVLQEQSQLPSFPDAQVEADVYPYAALLDSLIEQYNACAKTMFYMTWGRKNGDASNCATWPPVCTYSGMDSLLRMRYTVMANNNQAEISPAGPVWKYIRQHYPAIELYQADESHPSAAGSYAAACCFYTAIFKKDPTAITYNFTLSPTDAAAIRTAVKAVVYDSLLTWNIGFFTPVADFTSAVSDNDVNFTNTSENSGVYAWDFGDGSSSGLANPSHTYATLGIFNVTLVAGDCYLTDTLVQQVEITSLGINETPAGNTSILLYPNPSNGRGINLALNDASLQVTGIHLADVTGRTWFHESFPYTASNRLLNICFAQTLPPGIYLLTLTCGHSIYTKKMMVE